MGTCNIGPLHTLIYRSGVAIPYSLYVEDIILFIKGHKTDLLKKSI